MANETVYAVSPIIEVIDIMPSSDTSEYTTLAVAIFLLIVGLVVGHEAHQRTCRVPANVILMVVSCGIASLVRFVHESDPLSGLTTFDASFFFSVVLPPILFTTGFNLKLAHFRNSVLSVIVLAFLGTLLSGVLTAYTLFGVTSNLQTFHLTLLECALLASIVSATDPVSVAPLFDAGRAPRHIYALVLGESALNDVVSVVAFRLILNLYVNQGDVALGQTVRTACGMFFGAVGIAILVSAAVTLIARRHARTSGPQTVMFAQFILWPYLCYATCECLGCSGIVGILVCGIFIARYALPQLPTDFADSVSVAYQALADTMECFVAIYFGMALSTFTDVVAPHIFGFAALAALTVLFTRAVVIGTLCTTLNWCRRTERYSCRWQSVLWAAGMRGSIAFALVSSARRSIPNAQVLRVLETATITVTLVTIAVGVVFVPIGLKSAPPPLASDIHEPFCLERCEQAWLLPPYNSSSRSSLD